MRISDWSSDVCSSDLSHPQLRESDALTAVAGLSTLPLGDPARCLAADDLRRVRDRVDVLMLELPLRDAGFVLPTWMELVELATEARAAGAALPIHGARRWACTPPFRRPLAQIRARADSVYLSFYKSLCGPACALLAGKAAIIAPEAARKSIVK